MCSVHTELTEEASECKEREKGYAVYKILSICTQLLDNPSISPFSYWKSKFSQVLAGIFRTKCAKGEENCCRCYRIKLSCIKFYVRIDTQRCILVTHIEVNYIYILQYTSCLIIKDILIQRYLMI